MAEIRTVTTLVSKRDEIRATIHAYEQKIAQARVDLAHVTACIALFEASGDRAAIAPYVDVHRLFARGEPIALCIPGHIFSGLPCGPRFGRRSIGGNLVCEFRCAPIMR